MTFDHEFNKQFRRTNTFISTVFVAVFIWFMIVAAGIGCIVYLVVTSNPNDIAERAGTVVNSFQKGMNKQ